MHHTRTPSKVEHGMHSPYRLMSIKALLCLARFASMLFGCAPGSYLTPPESDDPWTLIEGAGVRS